MVRVRRRGDAGFATSGMGGLSCRGSSAFVRGSGALRYSRSRPLLLSVVLAILLSIVLAVVQSWVSLSENLDHALFHLALAIPASLLAWSIAFWCPRRKNTRAARWGRGAAIWGLVSMSAGLGLEAIGAFGYDGDDSRIGALTTLHNSAFLVQIPGLPLLVAAILLGIASLFQRTADPVPSL